MTTGIYARVSTESGDQAHALEQQLHRLRSKAADLGEPVEEFVDVMSGTRDDRPELRRLLHACETGQLTTVLCTRLDRMSRSTVHGGKLLRLFNQQHWPNLICLDQPIDLATASGRFYAGLLMGMAQMESELIGERVHHGQMYARTKLKPQSGKPPWGYRYTAAKANYEIDPVAGPLARQLIEQYLAKADLHHAYLWQEQHCGRPFHSLEGLRRWFLNPALTGARVYGTCEMRMDKEGNKRRLLKQPGIVDEQHPNAHPPLLSSEEQLQISRSLFRASRSQLRPIQKRRTRVLTGLAICDHCGHLMQHHHPKPLGPHYLRCTNPVCPKRPHISIREEVAVAAVIKELERNIHLLAHVGVVEEMRLRQQLSPQMSKLQHQILDLQKLQDPDVEAVIASKRQRLDRLMTACVKKGGSRFSVEQAEAALRQPETWLDLTDTPEKQRLLFSQWLEKVVIRDGAVTKVDLRVGGGGGIAEA